MSGKARKNLSRGSSGIGNLRGGCACRNSFCSDRYPTNMASVHLVMGCPNSRAGFGILKKPLKQLEQPKSLISTGGVAVGVSLLVPVLVG